MLGPTKGLEIYDVVFFLGREPQPQADRLRMQVKVTGLKNNGKAAQTIFSKTYQGVPEEGVFFETRQNGTEDEFL